jgi:magnesium transporter
VCSMNGDTNGATDSEHVIHGALPLSVIRDRISGVELFESVDDKLAARALQAMDPPLAAPLLDALDSDNAANILREHKGPKREALLTSLPMEQATVLRGLFSWPEDSAAAHMVRDTLTVRPNMTVSEAVRHRA